MFKKYFLLVAVVALLLSVGTISSQAAEGGIHPMTDMPKWQITGAMKGFWPDDYSGPITGITHYDVTLKFDRQVNPEFIVARYNVDGHWREGKVKYTGDNVYVLMFDFGAVKWARVLVGVCNPLTGYPNVKEFLVNAWKTTPDPFGRKRE